MNRVAFLLAAALVLALPALQSCTTAYGVARDPRSMDTIWDDTKIKNEIRAQFVKDDNVSAWDVSVYSYRGHVYLVGEYETQTQIDRAKEICRHVAGVKNITTYLLKKPDIDLCGSTDNLTIKAKVTKNLIEDDQVVSTNIDVDVVQCNIVLLGVAASKHEADRAVADAKTVPEARSVKSFLTW